MATPYIPHTGPIVTRAEAKAAGLTRYFTGKPCRHGHRSQRYTANGQCPVCMSAHVARWQAKNRQHFATYAAAYRAANKDKETARAKAWRAANRDRFDANAVIWQKANREKINARLAAWKQANYTTYTASRKIREKINEHKIKAQRERLRLAFPERWRCYTETRRARKLAAGGHYTPQQIADLGVSQRHRCPCCNASIRHNYEIDHVIALSKGGSNGIENIQLLCKPCNRSKGTKDLDEWSRLRKAMLDGQNTSQGRRRGYPEGS